jgi:phosphoglycerate dehydrogenase-like enzyme
MLVAFNWRLSSDELKHIQQSLPDVEHRFDVAPLHAEPLTAWERAIDSNDLVPLLNDAEVLVALGVVPFDVFRQADSLRFVTSLEHGVNWLPFDLLRQRGVQVTNVRGARDVIVAEQAFALLLGCARRLIDDARAVREARYQQNWAAGQLAVELRGETLAIIGLGGIGRQIARRAKAFDMHVLGVRRDPRPTEDADEVFGPADLQDVLSRARFVILVPALTPATYEMMNDVTLRWMRPDAYLVNVGRAALVHEGALYRALTDGGIAGYATDVWWDYGHTHFGVPSRLAVHELPNVIGTGDRSINVAGDWRRVLDIGLDNVRGFIDGRPLARLIDLASQY